MTHLTQSLQLSLLEEPNPLVLSKCGGDGGRVHRVEGGLRQGVQV